MFTSARVLGAVLAAALLSGCGVANIWNESVHQAASITPAAPASEEAVPDDRTLHAYDGTLTSAKCVTASAAERNLLEQIGQVGGAVRFPVAARVRSTAGWWTVAAVTRVNKHADAAATKDVEPYAFFVTSYPTYRDDPDHEPFAWQLDTAAGDAAAARALACVKKLPVPAERPEPGSPATYTGRLAAHANCTAVSTKLLDSLEQVGRVGGAITYPRGQMVRANGTWWTVAVATQVNPNGEGYTKANVEASALFVTNAPSHKASSKARIVSFPVTAKTAGAAGKKALGCLGG